MKPLTFTEKILFVASCIVFEGVEYAYDTKPNSYFINGTTLGMKCPSEVDLGHRWTFVGSIGYTLLVANVIGFCVPRDYQAWWAITWLLISSAVLFLVMVKMMETQSTILDNLFLGTVGVMSSSVSMYTTSFTDGVETYKLYVALHELSIYWCYFYMSLNDLGLSRMYMFGIMLSIFSLLVCVVFFMTLREKCDDEYEDTRLDSMRSYSMSHSVSESYSQSMSESGSQSDSFGNPVELYYSGIGEDERSKSRNNF